MATTYSVQIRHVITNRAFRYLGPFNTEAQAEYNKTQFLRNRKNEDFDIKIITNERT